MKILDACCGGKMFWYEKDLDNICLAEKDGELFVVKGKKHG